MERKQESEVLLAVCMEKKYTATTTTTIGISHIGALDTCFLVLVYVGFIVCVCLIESIIKGNSKTILHTICFI